MSGRVAWITGAGGLIGNALVREAPRAGEGWRPVPLTRQELDLADFHAVQRRFVTDAPSLVIHCAGMTRSPQCEQEPDRARLLNVEVTAFLADLATEIPFVFFSTDLVFDGRKGNYSEADTVSPRSVYAQTKAEAEHRVRRNPRHTVIRTSLNAGISPTGDRGFNEQMRRALESGTELELFTDEFRSPISARVTARAVWELAQANVPGLYHVAGTERLSRWEIGRALLQRWPRLPGKIRPGSLENYAGAPRSPDTSLECAKVQRLLSFPLPGFSRWLLEYPDEPL